MSSFTKFSDSISAPALKLRDSDFVMLVIFPSSPCPENTADTEMLPIGRVSNVSSPSELYIITRLTLSEICAMTFTVLGSRLRSSSSILFSISAIFRRLQLSQLSIIS